jgi:alcohol dehydrogenase class IV
LAKAAAGLFFAAKPPAFYQEGGALEKTGLPFLAVPTTAGTGSEATPNAVIVNREKRSKLSIRHPSFLPQKIILDPGLLAGQPRAVFAHAGLDAIVQGYEAFTSKNAVPQTDRLAFRALSLLNEHFLPALENLSPPRAEAMLLASYLAGEALAAARLGVIHGLAHPLGVIYGLPHGLVCAACFPAALEFNRPALGAKYETLCQLAGADFESRVGELISKTGIGEPFRGKPLEEKEKIIRETLESGSTAANPRPVTRPDVERLLSKIFRT